MKLWLNDFLNAINYTFLNMNVWNLVTLLLFAVATVLFALYIVRLICKKDVVGHNTLLWTAYMNIALYLMPVFYCKFVLESEERFLWMLIKQVGPIIKMFVGEASVDAEISVFATACPLYVYVFALGLIDVLFVSFYAAASALSDKIFNSRRLNKKSRPGIIGIIKALILKKEAGCCDIIIGCSDEALNYAVKNNAVILKESSDNEASFSELIGNGYTVLCKDFTCEFLKSHFFKKYHRYNFIYLGQPRKAIKNLNTFINYLNSAEKPKDIYLYVELPEAGLEAAQNHITQLYKEDERIRHITVFGRDELSAREFIENEPITKYMPKDYIDEKCSIKPDKKINVVMLGFTNLNRELLKQYIMNNQLASYKDGKYQLLGINYYIFGNGAEDKNWEGFEVESEFKKLNENKDLFFELPELPWLDKINYFDKIPAVSELENGIVNKYMNEDTYSVIIIDTGDLYLNMKLENKLHLLLSERDKIKHHIYVRRGDLFVDNKENIDCYGEYEKILARETIIDEKLLGLAKRIAEEYASEKQNALIEWKTSSYFDMYSNIYTANSLRLKLNLMGYDYTLKNGADDEDTLMDEFLQKLEKSKEYHSHTCYNSLLAQEHYRWNAYHLMSGYLPKPEGTVNAYSDRKDYKNKRHSLITTFSGIKTVEEKILKVDSERKSLDLYINDGLIFEILPEYFKANNLKLIKK